MPRSIDLNCDVGELGVDHDRRLLPWVSSCNLSCGAHAGDADSIAETLLTALEHGVAVGAHPSYEDREGQGRRSLDLPHEQVTAQVRQQVEWLQHLAESHGASLHHVKPHGALYHDINKNLALAETVIDAIKQAAPGAMLYGMAGSLLETVCEERGVRFVPEAFADRRYEDGKTLRARSHDDALLTDPKEVSNQIESLLRGEVIDVRDQCHALHAETLCLHSDTPGAEDLARLIHETLEENDVRIAAP